MVDAPALHGLRAPGLTALATHESAWNQPSPALLATALVALEEVLDEHPSLIYPAAVPIFDADFNRR